ncbi:GD25341 [Drosophila simulans]|uniref:GD25341 n=1 Tax=Drosophila simulans TaxID=7240 RepID=B4QDL2_DROSI|nr:GD25341 [Drosophila simulans]
MMFNVIAMMRIVKRESISVFYWMCETGALLIFRVHHIYYNVDEFWLAETYIGLSLLAMIYVMCGLELESQYPEDEMENDCKFDPESAKRAAQKDEAELLARNQEEQAHLEQRKLESDREMEELNRKATLKLAQLEEERSLSSQEIAPTAPEEENLDSSIFLMQDFPGPSAPPESVLSIEPDFYYEINDIVDSGDQQNY